MIEKVLDGIKTITLLFNNYNYRSIKEYKKYKKLYISEFSDSHILKKWPVNGSYERIFGDIVASRKVLKDDNINFTNQIVRVGKSLNKKVSRKIIDETEVTITEQDVYKLIKENKHVIVRNSSNLLDTEIFKIDVEDNCIYLDGKAITENACNEFISNLPIGTIIYQKFYSSLQIKEYTGFAEPVLHISQLNIGEKAYRKMYYAEHMKHEKLRCFAYEISEKAVNKEIEPICRAIDAFEKIESKFSDIKYINVAFRILEDRYEILQIDTGLDLLFEENLENDIKKEFVNLYKPKVGFFKTLSKYGFAIAAKKKGFVDYMYKYWLKDVFRDTLTHTCSFKDLRWAHKRGFYSYRIEQYGLTDKNYKDFLSDREYKKMRPINSKYNKLLTDKLLTYYLLNSRFEKYIPRCYCKLVNDNEGLHFYKVNNSGYTSFEEILKLLKEKKKLICKKIVGSHGDGLIKLEYFSEDYIYINNEKEKVARLLEIFENSKSSYIVTEYIEMHDELKKICSDVTCTIRMMTINIGNERNVIKDAYFKFATKNTGITDNVSKGGIVAKINLETGEIYKPELLTNHKFHECLIHPDSKYPIKGVIPNWQIIKNKVIEICDYLSELEYLGFDVVVTNKGFKILEINTHQDLHKYAEYSNEIKEYFKIYLREK